MTRGVLGPILVRREHAILKRLAGVPGIPRTFGIVDGRALLIETTALATLGWLKANRPDQFLDHVEKSVRWVGR